MDSRRGRYEGGRGGGTGRGGFGERTGRGGFGGPKKFGDRGGRDGGDRTMHKAICDECGDSCMLPFRPSGDKPVYCNNCFRKDEGEAPRKPARREFSEQRFERVERFGNDRKTEDNGFKAAKNEEKHVFLMERLDAIEKKMDKILKQLTPVVYVDKGQEQEVKEVKAEKAEKVDSADKPAKKISKKKKASSEE